jgi:phosphoglucosamine mutase
VTLRFGTDGVRGVANVDLTPELILRLGRAAARVLGADRFVVGRDPRASGPMIEAALTAGLCAEGVAVELMGIVPTPAVAWAASAAQDGRRAGAVISASHNSYEDNGVKLFLPGGRKLSDEIEERLEAELERPPGLASGEVGTVTAAPEHQLGWLDSIAASIEGRTLDGLRLVVDCSNGAASVLGPHLLRRLGAEVIVLHAAPDGTNINAGCGSTHPADVQAAVVEAGADAGLAFDGDADRVLAVDAGGALVDGDQILAVCAVDRHERERLAGGAVAATVMSNLGFRQALADRGIEVVETPVGDRYVLEALEARGLVLGGEQSGHLIFRDLATTGDGLLTAVQLLDVVARRGRPLGELAAVVERFPQVLRNVRVAGRGVDVGALVGDEIAAAERELGPDGRVLVRASGTEPLVRVMVEARTDALAADVADRLVTAVESAATKTGL